MTAQRKARNPGAQASWTLPDGTLIWFQHCYKEEGKTYFEGPICFGKDEVEVVSQLQENPEIKFIHIITEFEYIQLPNELQVQADIEKDGDVIRYTCKK